MAEGYFGVDGRFYTFRRQRELMDLETELKKAEQELEAVKQRLAKLRAESEKERSMKAAKLVGYGTYLATTGACFIPRIIIHNSTGTYVLGDTKTFEARSLSEVNNTYANFQQIENSTFNTEIEKLSDRLRSEI